MTSAALPAAPDSGRLAFIVRPFTLADAAGLGALLADPAIGGPLFGRCLGAAQAARHVHDAWVAGAHEPQVVACPRATPDRPIGAARLSGAQVSYFVGPPARGTGAATLMLASLCALADARRHRAPLQALIERGNRASIRVAEKCLFRYAGPAAGDGPVPGGRPALLFVRREPPVHH